MVYKDGFCNLLADFYSRVQGGHRILENHGKGTAADFLHFLFFIICNVSSVKKDFAGFYLGTSRQKLHDAFAQYTFSAAGFAYNGQHFSFFQGKRDVPHSLYFSSCTVKADGQVFHFQNIFFWLFHYSAIVQSFTFQKIPTPWCPITVWESIP